MAREFHTDGARVALSLSSYFIGLALGQNFYGPFLDRFGRKRPLYFGLCLYVIASLACIYSGSIEALIAYRFLQAIGGCAAGVAATAMVRDFYGPKESAKIFSLLMLILSVSPLFAPTVGGFIAGSLGWRAVFVTLALIVCAILAVVFFFLPEGHDPDPSVSLDLRSVMREFGVILKDRPFFYYSFSGAFSFAGLFIYLAGAPTLFLSGFHLSERAFGAIFAFLSVGMVGGGQFNILLSKRFSTRQIFGTALIIQVLTAAIFVLGSLMNWFGLYSHIAIFFVFISSVGLIYPNAAAMALAPFEKNAGSAAALLGFIQMGVGSVASAGFSILPFQGGAAMSILFFGSALAANLISWHGGLRPW
jgi:DHA1 family bicyclomycin/chloramphenicol resistance-like MFS transporter